MIRREKTIVRRQQIIDSTLTLLAEVPLADLTTRRIARSLGLSQPALFRHFRSRDALLLAVLERARGDLGALLADILGGAPDPIARLGALAAGLLAYTQANPGLPRLLFADLGPSPGGAGIRDALRGLVTMQRSFVAVLVADGQRAGALRADLDPARAAALFVGLVQGAILQWELMDRTAPLADEAGPLARLWLDGARSHPGAENAAMRHGRVESEQEDSKRISPGADCGSLQTLDARPSLARGIDPLDAILAAVAAAGPTGLVCVTAPFRPVPLLALLAERGHRVAAREGPAGVWSVDVVVGGAPAVLDLTSLAAPEPLERLLAATARMVAGEVVIARVPRVPRLLLARLEVRPELRWGVHEYPDGAAVVRVARVATPAPPPGAAR